VIPVPRRTWAVVAALLALVLVLPAGTLASHSWGGYHWARTSSPFTLQLGDNVSGPWDSVLGTASADWSGSSVLDTTVVSGRTTPKQCKATTGRVEVCNSKYGNNGWLGLAQVWLSGRHITKGVVKVNDYYFNTSTYNTTAWRNLVMCQEVGHTLGLGHVDENFTNANLGTCMDYTRNPLGPPDNQHPNSHDYDQLVTIYSHFDSTTTVGTTTSAKPGRGSSAGAGLWGRVVASSNGGRTQTYLLDLGNGESILTFVVWADR
jgi:hypothetical protein